MGGGKGITERKIISLCLPIFSLVNDAVGR